MQISFFCENLRMYLQQIVSKKHGCLIPYRWESRDPWFHHRTILPENTRNWIPFLRKDFQILKLKVFPFNDGEKWVNRNGSIRKKSPNKTKQKKTVHLIQNFDVFFPPFKKHTLFVWFIYWQRDPTTLPRSLAPQVLFLGGLEKEAQNIHQTIWYTKDGGLGQVNPLALVIFGRNFSVLHWSTVAHNVNKTLTFHEILIGSWPDLYFMAYEIFPG